MYVNSTKVDLSSEPAIPRRALVVFALAPLVIAAVFLAYFLLGGEPNPHTSIPLGFMLALAATAIAMLVEIVLVPTSIVRLLKYPQLRTPQNIWSVAVAGAFAVMAAIAVLVGTLWKVT